MTIAAEVGFDRRDLLECVAEGEWVSTPVVEYRYAIAHPEPYRALVEGLSAAPAKKGRPATLFVAHQLGQLPELESRLGRATGAFSHHGTLWYWARKPGAPLANTVTWASFAAANGLDPDRWPFS